ncbi:MAG: hypothetical protein WBD71_17815 [Xanthobacteraceae bacterium]
MSVRIEATGKTIADALAVFGPNLESAATDELLLELRNRLASQNKVVKIVPFAEGKSRTRKAA